MTQRLMKDAILELLEKTELSSISVTDVCKAAGETDGDSESESHESGGGMRFRFRI